MTRPKTTVDTRAPTRAHLQPVVFCGHGHQISGAHSFRLGLVLGQDGPGIAAEASPGAVVRVRRHQELVGNARKTPARLAVGCVLVQLLRVVDVQLQLLHRLVHLLLRLACQEAAQHPLRPLVQHVVQRLVQRVRQLGLHHRRHMQQPLRHMHGLCPPRPQQHAVCPRRRIRDIAPLETFSPLLMLSAPSLRRRSRGH
eukprot:2156472-Rhodomonas_salina.1